MCLKNALSLVFACRYGFLAYLFVSIVSFCWTCLAHNYCFCELRDFSSFLDTRFSIVANFRKKTSFPRYNSSLFASNKNCSYDRISTHFPGSSSPC
ncbi:hypothetical protein L596_005780 [Steinernema carpocapsae]|uniref:Uncharacterized protein n=1 Tax=Steinernema carpocapsae TaxID=34508 RepID=A0A4U8V1P7_STECR|nr:hypothetical protein L596_005780 [Steinernema carpocapsae]